MSSCLVSFSSHLFITLIFSLRGNEMVGGVDCSNEPAQNEIGVDHLRRRNGSCLCDVSLALCFSYVFRPTLVHEWIILECFVSLCRYFTRRLEMVRVSLSVSDSHTILIPTCSYDMHLCNGKKNTLTFSSRGFARWEFRRRIFIRRRDVLTKIEMAR